MANKKMFAALALALAVTAISTGGAEAPVPEPADQYLCLADASAGFSVNKATKVWTPTTFKTEAKYLIRKSKAGSNKEVVKVGEQYASFTCDQRDPQVPYLHCEGFGGEFFVNYANGRFEARSLHFYAISSAFFPEGDNDLWVEIGKCSPL